MDVLTKVSKQTFWQILSKIITSISTFIILGIVARNYHEIGTGIFTLTLTYLAIFNLLSDFGFNAHQLRKDNFEWQKVLGTRLIWSTILILLAILLLPLLPFSNKDFTLAVIFGILGIYGSAVFISCNLIFQKQLRYDLSAKATIFGSLIGLGAAILLTYLRFSIAVVVIANLISWLAISFFALLFLRKLQQQLLPIFSYKYALGLFWDSWPIALTLGVNVVYFRADSFIVTFYQGISQAGIYNLAYSIFQSALVLPTFIMNAYYPLMLKSFSYVKSIAFGLIVLAILGTFLTLILAPSLIDILTGSRGFSGSIISLQILSLGFPAFFLSSLYMWMMLAKGKYKIMLSIYLIGLISNLILNFIYIPKYSYIAASWITVFSEYLILILQVLSFSKFKEGVE